MSERQEKLLDLLERYHELAEQGLEVRPTELCAEWSCPELLQELQAQLRLERWVVPQGTPVPSAVPDVAPTIPNHDILELLGRGGMGVVYKARDRRLKRFVAVKVIGTGILASGQLARFQVEAEALGRLSHPHIVQVFDVGSWQPAEGGMPLPYLLLEYVAGETLEKRLGFSLAKPVDAARLLILLARAVEQAHQAGIIHRDLKPGNVLLAPAANDSALNCAWGWPKLTDFGLARRMERAGLTHSGAVMGTPNYMAPEQASGQIDKIGPKVDVYGLAGILYRLLTGQHPFRDANRQAAPPSPRSQHTSVPEKLSLLCMRCLAPTPADRPSVADLIRDLEQFLSGDLVTGPTVGTAQPAERLAVMISSTSLDLPQHRDTVNEAIRRVGYYPLAMEHGSAEAGSNALSFSLRMVDQADLFIGVIAFRYGYVPADPIANPNGWSVTEHECRRAIQRGIPVLIFLMDAAHPDARKDAELCEPAQRKLEALKAELKTNHIVVFFRSVDQLQARVIQSLSEIKLSLIQRHRPRGSSGPFQSPPVPAHYVRRPDEEKRLEDDLLRQDEGPGVVVSAVFGLGGIGKSTLAAVVVQSQRVQERFADGVLWLTLGQNPELRSHLGQWLRDLGDHEFRAIDVRSASGRLRQLLQDRAVLLVVDDAWQSEHVEPFQVGGPRCRLLVTTRKPRIVDDLHAISHELGVLSPEQAVELLATQLQRPLRDDEHGPARRLAEAVGRLPLALELAAVRIGRRVSWEDLLLKLEQEVAALEALEDPAERWKKKVKTQLEASLQLSLRALREEAEEAFRCFVWLGVLPDDTTLAAPMASALWAFQDAEEADGLLEFLWGEALLQPGVAVRVGGKPWRAYRVHDLLHDCARRLLEAPVLPRRQGEMPGLGLTRPEAHRQLLGRYRKRTRDGLWHTLAADCYIHGRLGWHLEKAGDVEGLHALLREETADGRNGWYEANERLGQPANFMDTVAQAWRLADDAFHAGGPTGTLGVQCRYALVTASLNNLAGNIPSELLVALVQQGLWPFEQGLAYARRKPDARQKVEGLAALVPLLSPGERPAVLAEALAAARAIGSEKPRSGALAALAPHLVGDLLAEAVAAARAIGSKWDRCDALAALALHLAGQERRAVLAEALAAARAIGDEENRSRALAALAPHLPAELLSEALSSARSIGNEEYRYDILTSLAPHLPEPERAAVLAEALAAARSLHYGYRARALAGLAPHLPEQERAGVLAEAMAAVRSIGPEEIRSTVLAAIAPHLPEPERAAVLAEALAAVRSIGDPRLRSTALAGLAPHLPQPERAAVLPEALTAARCLGDEKERSKALAALAPHQPAGLLAKALTDACSIGRDENRYTALAALAPQLPAGLLSEALAAARSIGDAENSFTALAALATYLPELERAAVLADSLAAARSIGDEGTRYTALAALATRLPEQERAPVLAEALAAARSIGKDEERYTALAALAARLPEQDRAAVLAEALAAAHSIRDAEHRVTALAALATHLPEPKRTTVLAEALAVGRSLRNTEGEYGPDSGGRAEALVSLAPHLPAALLSEALAAARSLDYGYRSTALAGLAPHLPEQERAVVLSEALAAVRSIWADGFGSTHELAKLAPHLPGGLLSEALAAVRSIRSAGVRSTGLAALAPHLPAGLLSEALAAIRSIQYEAGSYTALAAIAPRLPAQERAAVLAEALVAARAIGSEEPRSGALAALAPHLPAGLLSEALAATRSIGEAGRRFKVLSALVPHLPEQERAAVLAEALVAARAIGSEEPRSGALAALAPHLPAGLLSEALAAARSIGREWERSNALAALAPHLSAGLLSEALAATRSIGDAGRRFTVLSALAPHLPEQERAAVLAEALVAARSIGREWERSNALAALAPRLAGLSSLDHSALWLEALRFLAARTRRDLLAVLHNLAPVFPALAGPNASTELREVARAISDVVRWWP